MPPKQKPGLIKPIAPSNAIPAPSEDAVDVTRKFMAENPKGSLPDSPEVAGDVVISPQLFDDTPPETPEQQPDVERDSQGEPVAPVAAKPEEGAGEKPSAAAAPEEKPGVPAEKPAAVPAAEAAAKPAAEVAAAVEPPKPSYAPDEKIFLLEGSDPWTREQVVAGLQERATLQPKAEAAEKFQSLFGVADYAKAEAEWKPILELLRSKPDLGPTFDAILQADDGLRNYVAQSIAYYNSLSPEEKGVPAGATAAQPAHDPRVDKIEKTFHFMQRQAIESRARNEWEQAFQKYPFLRSDEKARQALSNAAGLLFTNDEKAGKDPLECRGLLEAMAENAVFLESMGVAHANRAKPAPARETPVMEPQPGKGPEALLGSTGPGPAVAPATPKPKIYKGSPDNAVAAFTADYPGN